MSKETRFGLIRWVARLQNHPANINQDHMTICGFFTTAKEFQDHIQWLSEKAANHKGRR